MWPLINCNCVILGLKNYNDQVCPLFICQEGNSMLFEDSKYITFKMTLENCCCIDLNTFFVFLNSFFFWNWGGKSWSNFLCDDEFANLMCWIFISFIKKNNNITVKVLATCLPNQMTSIDAIFRRGIMIWLWCCICVQKRVTYFIKKTN